MIERPLEQPETASRGERKPGLSRSMSVLPAVAPAAMPAIEPRNVARYQRIRALASGGNGEVDIWHDQDIDRQVAVKRLKLKRNPSAVAQFVSEVQTVGKLEHPGIVPIYDVGVDEEGNYFFVMKHIEGETLEQVIAKLRSGDPTYQRRFSYESRAQIFMQILRAVQYAHRKGYIHCDLKPANVIVGPFGEVMVLDWGLARRAGAPDALSEQRSGSELVVSGTPDYMAPEQAMAGEGTIDERTDTYSLCVLFYELVTLHYYLKPASTVLARLTSIMTEEPMTALQIHHRYGAPPELTNFIRPGLAKKPSERYQSVDEMILKLQDVMDGLIPVVCPCTGVKRAASHYGNFLNNHPIVGIALLVILGLITLFGLVSAAYQGIHLIKS